ncbi:MAG: TonB-dependent receptor [Bryobacterales bacterium]|nr:TonB-dependent receptor [Bryobacterales bacterium]
MSGRLGHWLLSVLCLIIFATLGQAQTATVTGRITDSTGAVVPGTQITVTNVATAAARVVNANEIGYYTVPLLSPGEYRITVEQPGFRPVNRTGIILNVDQRATIDFALELGSVSEQIEVSADALQLNTVEASQGQVIENRRIVDMPLNGRDYNQLALLSAGTVQPLPDARYAGFSSGGMRVTQNNFMLDGVDNNAVELAGAQRQSEMVKPSVDAVQEFKVQTNSYSAEFGRAMGSVVNVTTKSGTNDLHGTAFHFLRNEKLDAKNYFDPVDRPRPPFKRNQFGFSIGGPAFVPKIFDGRNKVFWFGNYEGTRVRESNTANNTIPTLRMRQGDFGDLLEQRSRTIIDPANRQPFANNLIPQSRFDPVASRLMGLYPTPQSTSVAANFVYNAPRPQDVELFGFRFDVNLGSKDNISYRYSQQDLLNPAALLLPPPAFTPNNDFNTQGKITSATWNHIFSPTVLMSLRGAWNFGLFKRDNPAQAGRDFLNLTYGIPGGNPNIPGGMSAMNITGYTSLGLGANNPVDRDSQNRQLVGDLTWIKGQHTIKMGANLMRMQNNIYNIRGEIGNYGFNGQFTNDGAADFLLGTANNYSWSSVIQVDLRAWNTAAFIQDDWKVSPNLTVNLGMRYELTTPFIDKRDRMGILDNWTDPANPRLIYAGSEGSDTYNRAMIAIDRNNFMPRVGFAYKLGQKTVLRSGYGVFFMLFEPLGDSEFLLGNPPNAFAVNLASSATVPAVLLKDGPPEGALNIQRATGLTFVSYERRPNQSYSQQWNFNIQQELARDWLFEIGYSGTKGTHLVNRYDDNFSPPGPGNINAKRPLNRMEIPGTGVVTSPLAGIYGYHHNGNSIYHGMITKLEKRFSQGFTLLTSYSFSKTIGDTCAGAAQGNTTGCGHQDLRNLRAERALDNQDVPHRLVVSGLYELPFGRGRRVGASMPGVVDAVLGGWAVGSIVTAASGRPYNATTQGNPANTGSLAVVNRPNISGNPYGGTRTVQRDFDIGMFTPNAANTLGTAGRNILRQRDQFGWDFSALKDFRIVEDLTLQFRFEAFQVTNTPRFGQAGAVVGTNTFGQITGAATPRNLQFGLKLIW